ncbi:biopolymer transporter ExbD [bacterium]|nr:biopolymer transporter ExbD [bacterium]
MKFKRTYQIEKEALNLTPLVDVIFLLLIFFMLSSSFMLQPGIKVNIPLAKKSSRFKEENMIVTMTQENQIFFNDERTTLEGLKRRMRRAVRKNPQGTLIIKADKNVRHGNVVHVMSLAKQTGIVSIAIATKSKDDLVK